MTEIHKKAWPELFQKVLEGKKNSDVRLADFDIKEGDILVLGEYNPETKEYTGRSIKKKVAALTKIFPTKFNSIEEINKHGQWLIELK